jgi:hypothetical protein
MAGETATYRWEPKPDKTFAFPKGPSTLDRPKGASIQIVHLKSAENPFQIVWPKGVSFDTYNLEPSYSMFEWWNHWPVAQVGSSGRPAVAPDRVSHSSLSHIYWDTYSRSSSPPQATLAQPAAGEVKYDPAQRAFVVHRSAAAEPGRLTIHFSGSEQSPLVNPVLVLENWKTAAKVAVLIDGKKADIPVRSGIEHHLEGDSVVLFLKLESTHPVQIEIDPTKE